MTKRIFKTHHLLLGFGGAAIATVIVFGIILGTSGIGTVNLGASLTEANTVVIHVDKVNGEQLTYIVHPNTMTIDGESVTENGLAFGPGAGGWVAPIMENGLKYISLGTTPLPYDNTANVLLNELTGGLARAAGTVGAPASPTWNVFTVSKKFTATATTTENCAGLHWDSASGSTGNLWAYAYFAAVTTNSGDNITITWTVTFTAGG